MTEKEDKGRRAEAGRARRGARAGMTLVEVMMAVVILGLALGGLVEVASRALAVVRQARNYETARRMLGRVEAENPLWLLDEIKSGEESGGFEGGPSGWSWSRSLVDFGEEDEQKEGLFQLTTRVYWSQGARRGMEETVQMFYVPKNLDGKRTLKPGGL